MTSTSVGVTSQTDTWSGDGVRLSAATGADAATTSFFVDRAAALPQVALERDGTGTVLRDEVYGLGRISVVGASGGIAYEHTDALGSVTDLAGSTGVPLAWSEASPYGAIRSAGAAAGAPADPFGFTGQFQDSPTGLYYLRARQYDPSIGRFLSTDPQPGGMADPYVSAYGYVSENPVRYTDPSGRCLFLCAAIGGVVGGLVGAITYAATAGSDFSFGGLAGSVALSAGTGAIIGFTGGVAAIGIASGALTVGGGTVLVGTAGYATGLFTSGVQAAMGKRVTAGTVFWNVAGSVTGGAVGGPATASLLSGVARRLLSSVISIGKGIAASGASAK